MSLNEADTRAKLIDPAIHKRGWTEDLIRREETAGSIDIVNGKARRRIRERSCQRLNATPAIMILRKEAAPANRKIQCYSI